MYGIVGVALFAITVILAGIAGKAVLLRSPKQQAIYVIFLALLLPGLASLHMGVLNDVNVYRNSPLILAEFLILFFNGMTCAVLIKAAIRQTQAKKYGRAAFYIFCLMGLLASIFTAMQIDALTFIYIT